MPSLARLCAGLSEKGCSRHATTHWSFPWTGAGAMRARATMIRAFRSVFTVDSPSPWTDTSFRFAGLIRRGCITADGTSPRRGSCGDVRDNRRHAISQYITVARGSVLAAPRHVAWGGGRPVGILAALRPWKGNSSWRSGTAPEHPTRTSSVAKGRTASIHCRPAPPRQTEALSSRTSRSRPLKTSQRGGYARRKRSVPRLSRIGGGSVRRTRGQCSFYINEWPPWGKTFTPCAYFGLGYFQAVAAKRPSISLADGPELR